MSDATALPPAEATRSLAHRVAFRGTVEVGRSRIRPGDLVLTDTPVSGARGPGVTTVAGAYPPRFAAAVKLAELIDRAPPRRLVAVGEGATLDVAKQAWLESSARPPLVLVPVGGEAWRAFAPFTSLYEPDGGGRVSRPDPAHGDAQVVIDAELLAAGKRRAFELRRADSVVHAVEVLIGRRAGPWERALAAGGLVALRADAAEQHIVGAGLVTEAFAASGLGLAHAVASPLGAAAVRTHDTFNVLLAPYVVEFWGDAVDWRVVGALLGVDPRASAVAAELRALRGASGVAPTLAAAGLTWPQVEAAVPAAMRSSGMPWLPAAVSETDVAGLLRIAWGPR